jgi:hypothetical protein
VLDTGDLLAEPSFAERGIIGEPAVRAREVWFALDSLVEEEGFEPSVPPA